MARLQRCLANESIVDPGALYHLLSWEKEQDYYAIIAFENELVDFRKNYLCRYSAAKIQQVIGEEFDAELLKITFMHGTNSALLPSLIRTGMQLIPSGRLFQLGIVPFSGELRNGIGGTGVNHDKISGTTLDAAAVAKSYSGKHLHAAEVKEKEILENWLSRREAQISERQECLFQTTSDTFCVGGWSGAAAAIFRLRAGFPTLYSQYEARLKEVVKILERDWQWFVGSEVYNKHMPKELDQNGTLGYAHRDFYYYNKFNHAQEVIVLLKQALYGPVINLVGMEEALQNPYGLIFASTNLHAPSIELTSRHEHCALKAAKIGADIQAILVEEGRQEHLSQFLEQQGLSGRVRVLSMSALNGAVAANRKASPYMGDYASSKKLGLNLQLLPADESI